MSANRSAPARSPRPEVLAFLEAIKENPYDDMPRLMLADWFEERGEPRGEFIRAQVLTARMGSGDSGWGELTRRAAELSWQHLEEWRGRLPEVLQGWSYFQRGLLDLTTGGPDLLSPAGRALAETEEWAWVERLTLRPCDDDHAALLAASPLAAAVTDLNLTQGGVGDNGLSALAGSAHLRYLAAINLRGTGVGRRGIRDLVMSPVAERLIRLNLDLTNAGTGGAEAIAASSRLRRLSVLHLWGCGLDNEGVIALANSPILSGLRTLILGNNGVSDRGARELVASPYLRRLEHLNLRQNPAISDRCLQEVRDRFGPAVCELG